MSSHFDYIITGAGCAGSSLLVRMLDHPFFSDKRILIIDQSLKTENDRTWCYWEKEKGLFEPIVSHQWQCVDFFSASFSARLDLFPYRYKMIRGIDLYHYVKTRANQHSNVEWRHERVLSVEPGSGMATVRTETGPVSGTHVFNSILFEKPVIPQKRFFLWQHFMGWMIETEDDHFNPSVATFMDFRVSQEYGAAFMYVLPNTTRTALVEYAIFSAHSLGKGQYEQELRSYITNQLGIAEYEIRHTEFGMIPMTNIKFSRQQGNIFNIGTAGGQVKGSTGYAFQFIQKRAAQLVDDIVRTGRPGSVSKPGRSRFRFYDSVLLHVLQKEKMKGADIFAEIFRKNPPERVLCFLDNETGPGAELQIMRSVPSRVFMPAALMELIRSV